MTTSGGRGGFLFSSSERNWSYSAVKALGCFTTDF